jgi:hypothetical protein
MTSTDLEERVDVDLVSAVGCCWEDGNCTEEAVWAGVHQCCGYTAALCDPHKKRTEVDVEWYNLKAMAAKTTVRCRKCGADPLPPYIWRKL